jgi:hypothetical protein
MSDIISTAAADGSGGKKRKHGDMDDEEAAEVKHECFSFQLPAKSGSLELQHAIRLSGACFMQPFMP